MIIQPSGSASAEEIDEFRSALAVITAIHRGDRSAYMVARQLSHNSNDFDCALQAICNLLLQVIDACDSDITGESILDGFRSAAALATPTAQ
jgi:hypothetical protein